jgi:hypothetical protein
MNKTKKVSLKIKDIKKIIEKKYKVDLAANDRKRNTVYFRAIYFMLCREFTYSSLTAMGELVNRDHAGAIHGINNIFENQIKIFAPEYYDIYKNLCKVLEAKSARVRKEIIPDPYYKEKYRKVLLEYRGLIHRHKFSLKELRRMGHKFTESQQLKTYL